MSPLLQNPSAGSRENSETNQFENDISKKSKTTVEIR
jgi:hypothetical protein